MSKVILENIYKTYPGNKGGDVTAVENVNLTIESGEAHGLCRAFGLWQVDHVAHDRGAGGDQPWEPLHRWQES